MKNVLIIGGTGGIGSALVEQFSRAGYNVLFTYCHNKKEAEILCQSQGVTSYRVDVTQESDIMELAESVSSSINCLDVMVYATGIFEDALADKMTLDSWNRVVSTNLTGAFLATKHLLPFLRDSGNGRILYIGSVMGEAGTYGSCSYAATKAGLIALAKSVALENATKNVTANVLSYGYIDTGMTNMIPDNVRESALKRIPMKRLGDPQDAAQIAVDLCQAHTNYMSGQTIRVNGCLYV